MLGLKFDKSVKRHFANNSQKNKVVNSEIRQARSYNTRKKTRSLQ